MGCRLEPSVSRAGKALGTREGGGDPPTRVVKLSEEEAPDKKKKETIRTLCPSPSPHPNIAWLDSSSGQKYLIEYFYLDLASW